MPKTLAIIGCSIAICPLIEDLRSSSEEWDIVVFPAGGGLACRRWDFARCIFERKTAASTLAHPPAWYEQKNKIRIIDAPVLRVNLKKRCIVLEDKQQTGFDVLILAGAKNQRPGETKGIQKRGVHTITSWTDFNDVISNAPFAETIVIQSDGVASLRLALALQNRGKEVIWMVNRPRILSDFLDDETSGRLRELVEGAGVRVLTDTQIAEVLGDGDLKAVRVQSGKVFGAQMLILGQTAPDLRLFKDSELEMTADRFAVNDAFQTSLSYVFAVDDMADFPAVLRHEVMDSQAEALQQQGRIVGRVLTNKAGGWQDVVPQASIRTDAWSFDLVGQMSSADPNVPAQTLLDQDDRWGRVFFKDRRLVGAALVNEPQSLSKILSQLNRSWASPKELSLALGFPFVEDPPMELPAETAETALSDPDRRTDPYLSVSSD